MKIYHNPRCGTSRKALKLMKDAGKEPVIVEYLKNPPTKQELGRILDMLGMKAEDLIRKNEAIFKEKFKGVEHTNEEWIHIMVENPKLIQRPIVVDGDKAVVGRPVENVNELLE